MIADLIRNGKRSYEKNIEIHLVAFLSFKSLCTIISIPKIEQKSGWLPLGMKCISGGAGCGGGICNGMNEVMDNKVKIRNNGLSSQKFTNKKEFTKNEISNIFKHLIDLQ